MLAALGDIPLRTVSGSGCSQLESSTRRIISRTAARYVVCWLRLP